MWTYIYSDELYHHGILGMKWGVRRYQNYDGTYTKRGLARYNKARQDYDDNKSRRKAAKEAYKKGTVQKNSTKEQYKREMAKTRAGIQKAKRDMNKAYSKLKTDKMADEGKKLYQQGKTITTNYARAYLTQAAIIAGTKMVNKILADKISDTKVVHIATSSIALGGTAVNTYFAAKAAYENRQLRAYYKHS